MKVSSYIVLICALVAVNNVRLHQHSLAEQTVRSHLEEAKSSKFEKLLYPKLFADEDVISAISKNSASPDNEKLIVSKIVELTKNNPDITQALADELFSNDPILRKGNFTNEEKSTAVKFVMNHPELLSDKQPTEAQLNEWLQADASAKAIFHKINDIAPKSHLFSHLAEQILSHDGVFEDVKKRLYKDPEIKAKVDAKQDNTP